MSETLWKQETHVINDNSTEGVYEKLQSQIIASKWHQAEEHNTKTRLYNFDPLKPHFYIVKLGFTGVYIIVIISAESVNCGY